MISALSITSAVPDPALLDLPWQLPLELWPEEYIAALPKGMVIDQQYSRAELVDRTISTVEHNLGEGALLVALVLLFVMGNWRAALIVTLVIPLAFLVTVSGMHALGDLQVRLAP